MALKRAEPGARLHGAAEEGIPVRLIAEAIGAGLGLPVRSIAPGEAIAHFGWLGGFLSLDAPASSAITRATLGWKPREADLLTDLQASGYFG